MTMKKWLGALIIALAVSLAGFAGTSAAPLMGTVIKADSAVELAAKKAAKKKSAKKASKKKAGKKKAKKKGKKKASKAGKCGAMKYWKKGKCMDAMAKK